MATKAKDEVIIEEPVNDGLTIATPEKKPDYVGPYVDVFLPALEENGQGGMKVDQYEHVTIANEQKETCYKVLRGERVSVPVPVFIALKERYPKI
jgi:hypothetical protein